MAPIVALAVLAGCASPPHPVRDLRLQNAPKAADGPGRVPTGASAAVVISPSEDDTEQGPGAVAFVGGQSGDDFTVTDGMNYTEASFDTAGRFAVSGYDSVYVFGPHPVKKPRSASSEDGVVGTPFPLPGGRFAYIYNVGRSAEYAGYRYAVEYSDTTPAAVLPFYSPGAGLCGDTVAGLAQSDEVPSQSDNVDGTARYRLYSLPGHSGQHLAERHTGFSLGAAGMKTGPLAEVDHTDLPCSGGKLYALHGFGSRTTVKISSYEVATGKPAVLDLKSPAGRPFIVPGSAYTLATAMTVAHNHLIWYDRGNGDVYSADLSTGVAAKSYTTRLRSPGSAGNQVRATGDKIAVLDKPDDDTPAEVSIYRAHDGKLLSRTGAPSVDRALDVLADSAHVSSLAIR